MNQPPCQYPGCQREAISHSDFCGQHTNNRKFKQQVRAITAEKLDGLFWNEIELKSLKLSGKEFISPLISNADFTNVTFSRCKFYAAVFEHVVFTNCRFEHCFFEQADFTDVTLHETSFKNTTFEDTRFNEINLADDSVFTKCELDGCSFSGGLFSETGLISQTRFINNTFTQVSINQTRFSACQFVETAFAKTTFYNSVFHDCYFNTITNDFKLTGPPMLCDFRGSELINISLPRTFRRWNNLREQPMRYYLRVSDWLLTVDHPNYLRELALVLSKLVENGFQPDHAFIDQVKNQFRQLAAEAAQRGDYEIIGEILSAFGRIPQEFRPQTSFFLPPARPASSHEGGQVRLTITTAMDRWALADISRLLSLLAELEQELPTDQKQHVRYMEQGSFIIQVLGGLRQLVANFQSLLDFNKTRWEIKLKELEYIQKQDEIAHQRKARHLELKKSELDIYDKELDILKKLQEQTGFDYEAYRRTPKGKKAKAISDIIKQEFPVLHLKLEEDQKL